jgi:hypothetical protein
MGDHPEEDGRYAQLRQAWAQNLYPRFFVFFQVQALLVIILAVPVLLASQNGAPGLAVVEWAGLALWLVAIVGESLADRQLAKQQQPVADGRLDERCTAEPIVALQQTASALRSLAVGVAVEHVVTAPGKEVRLLQAAEDGMT